METLTGYIPAGGMGSRLSPHTQEMPKPLLLMGSSERRVIDDPIEAGLGACSYLAISTDYLGQQVRDYISSSFPNVDVMRDVHTVGSAGSLLLHEDFTGLLEDEGDTIVLPCDQVYENFDISAFWRHHQQADVDITLLTVPPKPYGEYVEVGDGGRLHIEKQALHPSSVSTTGIFIISNRYLKQWLREQRRQGWDNEMRNVYYDIICPAVEDGNTGVSLYHLDGASGYWDDVGTPRRYFLNNMRRSHGNNVIATESKINQKAVLDHCVVLAGTIIADSVEIRNAIVSSKLGKLRVTEAHGPDLALAG